MIWGPLALQFPLCAVPVLRAGDLLPAAFGVVMLGFVAMSLVLADRAPALLHLGLYSPVLLAVS